MAPLNTTPDQLMSVFATHTVTISGQKYSDPVSQAYPFYWCSLRNNDTKAFHSGLQLVLRDCDMRVLYNNGTGSALLRLDASNQRLNEAIQCVEDHVRASLEPHMRGALQPLRRIGELGDPALGVKCRYTAIDTERSTVHELTPRAVVSSCILTFQKITSYNSKLYIQCVLTAAIVKEDDNAQSTCGAHSIQSQDELFGLMSDEISA